MFRIPIPLIFASILLAVFNCEQEKAVISPILIETNKAYYSLDEEIMVELTNISDFTLYYQVCGGYDGIPPQVEKWNEKSWNAYASPVCFGGYCCGSIPSGSMNRDTLDFSFDEGTYRIEYFFKAGSTQEYMTIFSKSFKIGK